MTRDRLPAAILMSGTGSNARKLLEYVPPGGGFPAYQIRVILSDNPDSNFRSIAAAFGVEACLNDIHAFCAVPPPGEGGRSDPAARSRLRDPQLRRAFDLENLRILTARGVRLVAAAGYDWVISPEMCAALPILNVHPGDLRVRDGAGRRRYVGLGWIPTAKAILQGEPNVRSSVHLVTPELDGGPIARVSRAVPVDLPVGVSPQSILPPGATLGEVVRDLREGGRRFADALIVRHSRRVQERLKELGDWVEFPRTLHQVSELILQGRLAVETGGRVTLDGAPVPDLFLQAGAPAGVGRQEETGDRGGVEAPG